MQPIQNAAIITSKGQITLPQFVRQLTWLQVYADKGLRWEKVASIKPIQGIPAIYSLRITQSCRATAFREGDFMRFLTISADHDAVYVKK